MHSMRMQSVATNTVVSLSVCLICWLRPWDLQKWLNWLRCYLACWIVEVQGTIYWIHTNLYSAKNRENESEALVRMVARNCHGKGYFWGGHAWQSIYSNQVTRELHATMQPACQHCCGNLFDLILCRRNIQFLVELTVTMLYPDWRCWRCIFLECDFCGVPVHTLLLNCLMNWRFALCCHYHVITCTVMQPLMYFYLLQHMKLQLQIHIDWLQFFTIFSFVSAVIKWQIPYDVFVCGREISVELNFLFSHFHSFWHLK